MSVRSMTALACFLLLLSHLAACAEPDPSDGGSIDSGSHWLTICDESTDCGADLSCLCGVCTASCDAASTCEGVGDSQTTVRCAAPEDIADAQCGAEPERPIGLCLPECDVTQSCPEAGSTLACVDQLCFPVTEMLTCDIDACGDAPTADGYVCADGTQAGPTGLCVESDDIDGTPTCGWEIAQCVDNLCADLECGPPLGIPNETCDDGTEGGPTGRCIIADADAGCGWEVIECDSTVPPVCEAEECGPAPGAPNFLCDDGSVGGPACQRGDDGSCGWVFVDCPQ